MKPDYYAIATGHLQSAGIDFKVFDIYNPPSMPSAAELEAVEKIKKCHDEYMAECWDDANLEHISTLFSVALCDLTFKEYGLKTIWEAASQLSKSGDVKDLNKQLNNYCDNLNPQPKLFRNADLRRELISAIAMEIKN